MVKRKRPEFSPPPPETGPNQRKRIITKWFSTTAERSVLSSLRLAAGLERQKYSRRRKSALSIRDVKTVSRLESEYAALKRMRLHRLAGQHLRKTIAKVKSLRESEAVPNGLKVFDAEKKSESVLNVQGRLLKVQAVQKAVDDAIEKLKALAGVSEGNGSAKKRRSDGDDEPKMQKKAKLKEEADSEDGAECSDDESSDVFAAFDARIAAPSSAEEDSEDSLSEGDRPSSVENSDNGEEWDLGDEESEEDLSNGGVAIAPPSEDDEDDEDTLERSESESESLSESDEAIIPIPKPKRKAQDVEKPSTSIFLPSLSHAAYFSGSESEASDLEDLAPRKNRRGQRARQQIWEQKYKDKAKHLAKQERNKGWDPKRGAVNDDKGRKGKRAGKGGPPRAKGGRGPKSSGENAIPLGARKTKRDDTGSLHPSWQAAKAAKEKKVDMTPKGKKMVFD
ncbi:Bud-site selection protein [Trematosphaeria pertusa]|uniref:Bud-site selection protein n=1 Tax=Trematosphaeria pertusa TaxID=390896 RepID=A0A6A6IKQ3_9PLEO|nr:Bud-site selection protein [Trematosphaeria pertusa]KAF2250432.1 Bud-site selection protein [Trematosphaeria pertusa]